MKVRQTLALAALLSAGAAPALAAEWSLHLQTPDGKPVADAGLALFATAAATRAQTEPRAIIDQVDKEFVPYVSVLTMGTSVSFPNKDNIRHHVYSVSNGNAFELKLYSGTPAKPVSFDTPGLIVLGCNIHDWMLAYVWVVDTPYVGVSNKEGEIKISLPDGDYRLQLWHPEQKHEQTPLMLSLHGTQQQTLTLDIKKRLLRPRSSYP